MQIRRIFHGILVLGLFFSSLASAERFTDDSMARIGARIEEFLDGKPGGRDPKKALIAFDFDDTLLSTKQVLGSEKWFTWQENLLAAKAGEAKGQVAKDYTELLDIQSRLLGLVRFYPTEDSSVGVVQRLQKLGATVIVCTSRGFADFYSTLREMRAAGLDLGKSPLAKELNQYKPYAPYLPEKPEAAGLTTQELAAWGVRGTPRNVVFGEGLYLTEGQHKGAMLRTLLHRTKQSFESVVFVDNRVKHVDRVEKAFDKAIVPANLLTVFYTRINPEDPTFAEDGPAPNPFKDWKAMAPFVQPTR